MDVCYAFEVGMNLLSCMDTFLFVDMCYGFEDGMNLLSCMDTFFQYDMTVMFLISMWHM